MPMNDDLRNLVALHLVPGIGPRLTAALLERFGSAAAILRAAPGQLRQVAHIGDKLAHDLHQAMRAVAIDDELQRIAQHEVSLLALGSSSYPASLAEIVDPPPLLYLKGTLEERDAKAVAIVGSRQCTAYGRRMAERLATDLANKGYTIVSGMARGIDGCAHRGALKAGGRTVAVLAGGLSKIYPPEHAELADAVAASGGLLTEATMAMQPMAAMFPARNRLISGLSRAVIVVEAAEKSGALITARHAAEQGRAVFAVPGPVDNPASAGTHRLLRDGAVLIRGVDDVLEELEGVTDRKTPAAAVKAEPPPGLSDLQRRIWDCLAERARHVDEMTRHLAVPVAEVTSALMMLEMKKTVRRLPGNSYERT